MKASDQVWFKYTFELPDKQVHFKIELEPHTLKYLPKGETKIADWAKLENEKCANCPLNEAEHKYCPIALNLVNILPEFSEIYSYQETKVSVSTPERNYEVNTTLQRGLSSMLGIYMVTSGCPIMGKLKPMVRSHLPFASVEETIFRAASTYLLGQYFKQQKGEQADWALQGLKEIYTQVQIVNMSMADRLRSVPAKDANINALIVLDVFAKEMPINIEISLKPLEYLFEDL